MNSQDEFSTSCSMQPTNFPGIIAHVDHGLFTTLTTDPFMAEKTSTFSHTESFAEPFATPQISSAAQPGRLRFASLRSPLGSLPKSLRTMIRVASFCLAAYWLAIFCATHIPKAAMPNLSWSDKVYHAIAFAGLAFLLAWAIPKKEGKWLKHLTIAAVIAISYACLDEFTQRFIPGRTCDIWDVAADAVGTGIGLTCYLMMRFALVQFTWGRSLILGLSR